jgi:glycosyltransferase involved in cell wall biosynthesis
MTTPVPRQGRRPRLAELVGDRHVVIVHDWLTGMRGGEKVLESLCRLLPRAEVATLVHIRGAVSPLIEHRPIRTSLIQRFPAPGRLYRQYLPFFPAAIESFDLDTADVVISTSHCAAKAVIPSPRAWHICYCHTPMRYVWDQFDAYFGPARLGATGSAIARHVAAWLARWDRATAPRVNRFLANSQHVAARIARYYNRRALVVHAPADTEFFTIGAGGPDGSFLVVSALVPYKRIETAIRAAAVIGARLRIIGTGPDETRLRAMAGPTIEFLGAVSDDALRAAYRQAQALVLPGEEDFGIAPLESMACGRPVVALARGGACETVDDGRTGVLVTESTVEALAAAMQQAARSRFDPAALRAHAETFSRRRFEQTLEDVLTDTLMTAPEC